MGLPNIIQQINSKLPLSGGTITGVITFLNNWGDNIGDIGGCVSTNNNCLRLTGGEFAHDKAGGVIQLFNRMHTANAGGVVIRADNGTTSREINLKSDGTFTWGGNNVITSKGGTFNGNLNFSTSAGVIRDVGGTDTENKPLYQLSLGFETHEKLGGYIILRRGDSTAYNQAGMCALCASSPDGTRKYLFCYPDGRLLWDSKNVVCVTTWNSGANWYRKYSDGWIEQGGAWSTGVDTNNVCSFNIGFSNTNYTFVMDLFSSTNDFNRAQPDWIISKSTTSVNVHKDSYAGTTMWYACGY